MKDRVFMKMKCKRCGSNIGFYTRLKGVQYYNEKAEPQGGADVCPENYSVYCQECDKRVCSQKDFFQTKEREKK